MPITGLLLKIDDGDLTVKGNNYIAEKILGSLYDIEQKKKNAQKYPIPSSFETCGTKLAKCISEFANESEENDTPLLQHHEEGFLYS